MKNHSTAVRQLSRRIIHYKNMAVAFSHLTTERQMYVAHKFTLVVPNLERALAKALQGTRNICDDCEGEIPGERLEVVTGAIRCVICQGRTEGSLR